MMMQFLFVTENDQKIRPCHMSNKDEAINIMKNSDSKEEGVSLLKKYFFNVCMKDEQ